MKRDKGELKIGEESKEIVRVPCACVCEKAHIAPGNSVMGTVVADSRILIYILY